MKPFIVSLLICASPLAAEEACDDLWFTRNLIFDQAGYCFASELAQAIFDNSDCTTSNPVLSISDKARIDALKQMEGRWECAVATDRNTLTLHSLAIRRVLAIQPLRDDTESSCIDYLGPDLPVYDAPDSSAQIIGRVPQGATVLNAHVQFDPQTPEFTYASMVFQGETILPDVGWVRSEGLWQNCRLVAG